MVDSLMMLKVVDGGHCQGLWLCCSEEMVMTGCFVTGSVVEVQTACLRDKSKIIFLYTQLMIYFKHNMKLPCIIFQAHFTHHATKTKSSTLIHFCFKPVIICSITTFTCAIWVPACKQRRLPVHNCLITFRVQLALSQLKFYGLAIMMSTII